MIGAYACAHCGAPATALEAAISDVCRVCGKPWRRTKVTRNPINLDAIRARAGAALDGDAEQGAKVLAEDVPAMLSLVGELAWAVAALSGTCTCKPIKVRTRRVGPCPHHRGAQGLLRAGIAPEQAAALRERIDRKVA